MKSKLFCVRDQKMGVYADPFPSPTPGMAERGFENAIKSGQGDISKFPQDFDLYEVAEFDPQSGVVIPLTAPKHLCSGVNFVLAKSENPIQAVK